MREKNATSLAALAAALKHGGLVIYPTETAYALGADPRSRAAMKKVYAVKKRDAQKPVALLAASRAQVEKFFVLSSEEKKLASVFWPGPLTMILPLKDATLAKQFGAKTIGVRVTTHPVARRLAQLVGAPLVATSANSSGEATPYAAEDAVQSLGVQGNGVLVCDAGRLPKRNVSTVLRVEKNRGIIYREGAISTARIRKLVFCPVEIYRSET